MLEAVAKGTCYPPHSLTQRLDKMKYEYDHQFEFNFSAATTCSVEQLPTMGSRFKIIALEKIPIVMFTFPQRTRIRHWVNFLDGRFGRQ